MAQQVQIQVFQLKDTPATKSATWERIGEVNKFSSLMWPDNFVGYAEFELWAPITPENTELLKKGNIIWCGGENAAIIEIIKSQVDEDGNATYNVKGRTLEALLTTRIVWDTLFVTNLSVGEIMRRLVFINCVIYTSSTPPALNQSGSNAWQRKIHFLKAANTITAPKIDYQKTGGEVYDAVLKLAQDAGLGFRVRFAPKTKQLLFEPLKGVDRTAGQSAVDPVVFSTDLEDILTSEYYTNDQDYKCIARVAGEDSGNTRKHTIAGEASSVGFNRKELYVDARDLQTEVQNSDGSIVTLTPEQYDAVLVQRGNEKLSERVTVETFDVKLRIASNARYRYGIDYNNGDMITVVDKKLGVIADVQITAVEEDFGEEYQLVITLGRSLPSLITKVKQQLM